MKFGKELIEILEAEIKVTQAAIDNRMARWCNTRFGYSLRAEMPDGSVVWTTADIKRSLAKRGLKAVECKRPPWFASHSSGSGMFGVYSGDYVLFSSDYNYADGKAAPDEPLEIGDVD